MFTLSPVTIIACLIIIGCLIYAIIDLQKATPEQFRNNRRRYEDYPSFISTLGVFGTFFGITIGLVAFNTETLDKSIPTLLEGLKTAFFTSLLGMIGSITLTKMVNKKLDRATQEHSRLTNEIEIGNAILDHLRKLPATLENSHSGLINKVIANDSFSTLSQNVSYLNDILEKIKELDSYVLQLKDDVEELKGRNDELNDSITQISDSLSAISEDIGRNLAINMTSSSSIAAIDNNFKRIKLNIKEISEQKKENIS